MLPRVVTAGQKPGYEYFETSRTEVFIRGLDPAHDGLVVGQLSDLHVGSATPDERIRAAVAGMNALRPDLAVMTGDFVTVKSDPRDLVGELLGELKVQTFAVLGNHDHWTNADDIEKSLEKKGISVLRNEHTKVNVKGRDLTVFGLDDSTTKSDDVGKTWKGAPTRGSRLVLTHTPTGVRKLPPWSDLLCLSGHTHGGQIHVAGLTAAFFRRFGQPYLRGHYEVNGNQLYVNRGLGFGRGGRHPRVDSEPELALFVLRRAEDDA
ncbi:MAG: metallophosphoesterase, partial [Myxococcaceae bacterium]|nr:metallophosphoesterase [Myxococcaceae bacterium]